MTINPALAELETCRDYIVKRAIVRHAQAKRRTAAVYAGLELVGLCLGTLAALVTFLCS